MLFAIIITEVLVLLSVSFGYSGGSGTPEAPYQIAAKADLLELAATTADYNKCFILTADIDVEGQVFTKAIIGAADFTGTFDGNSHKITNFTIDSGGNEHLGLFGSTSSSSLVKNLGIENFAVSGASVSRYVGGLAGWNGGNISNCYSTGNASGTYFVGGLLGFNSSASITNCYSTGNANGDQYVGALVGFNGYGYISYCYSAGTASGSSRVGGLIGLNQWGNISNCYSIGAVNGTSHTGGLVGSNWSGGMGGIITNSYSTGIVSGSSDVGGLVGIQEGGSVISSYFLLGAGPDNGYGQPLTDAQMKQQASFIGWDFIEIWNIGENQTYPFLRKYLSSDINMDGRTDFFDFAILASHWLD